VRSMPLAIRDLLKIATTTPRARVTFRRRQVLRPPVEKERTRALSSGSKGREQSSRLTPKPTAVAFGRVARAELCTIQCGTLRAT
jgi:hypothetical protein